MSGVLRVGFGGDVSFTGAFARPASPEARFAPEVVAWMRANHHNVVNVEGPVTARPHALEGPRIASAPAAAAGALPFLHARVWNLANNHTLDSGPGGVEDTLAAARGEGARTFGAGMTLEDAAAPVVLDDGRVRVGLLAVCDGSGVPAGASTPGVLGAEAHDALVRARLAELRRSCDHVVLSYHGGEEYTFVPMPARRRRLLRYLELGANVVVAHHAHTVQGWERTERGLVFYGLGNLVFDHPALLRRPGTYRGMLLRLSFARDGVDFEPYFTRADRAAGTVSAGPAAETFAPVEAAGLRAAWCRDAHRLMTLPRTVAAENRIAGEEPAPASVPAPRPTAAARVMGRLRGAAYAARSPAVRAVVLGAAEHRLRRLVGGG
jgi:poly-gamma-glutamate synthesis protein (capsule biosynthesis protein)